MQVIGLRAVRTAGIAQRHDFSDLPALACDFDLSSGSVYVRTTKRENKSGTVRYLHLAHNEWDPVKGRAVPKVLLTFGREDELDRDAIRRLGRVPIEAAGAG
ncbi:hypothetical protein SSP531S_51360 [Streptomyces spongiicola]|uniref:Uncharacterized protein n=1 Tax=Streptomyces spongiicola TaxID=1690221 RepID=A0A388T636_9ACTN|nr:hypothetical protein SSP531S_51360 [Streptomyces spongiicola]